MTTINIEGLDKAEVLKALHDGTSALGMGVLHDLRRDMTIEEARAFIGSGVDDIGFRRDRNAQFHPDKMDESQYQFDYVCGRPLKVDIGGDTFDGRLYDRDAGEGKAEQVIAALRAQVSA